MSRPTLLLLLASFTVCARAPASRAGPPPSPREPHPPSHHDGKGDFKAPDPRWTTNPTSAARLAVYIDALPGGGPYPTLVFAPGGNHDGLRSVPPPARLPYLKAGFAVVTWDPDGRGNSGGTDDQGGPAQQDALAQVLAFVATQPEVDKGRIGVVSLSYGITIATGALTRHDTAARFLLDWEGPSNRVFTAGCGRSAEQQLPSIHWASCEDDAFWSVRESDRWIGSLKIPYERIQFASDHVQRDYGHTIDMVTRALAGGVPSVALNGRKLTSAPTTDAEVGALPNEEKLHPVLARAAKALMEEVTGQAMAPPRVPPRAP